MRKKTHVVNSFYCGLTVYCYTEYSKKIIEHLWAALITDLHSIIYGSVQEPLPTAVHSHSPDLILTAGDIVGHKVPRKETLLLLEGLKGQYPCYHVTGDHEHWIHQIPGTEKTFAGYGIAVLRGRTTRATIKGQPLIIGKVDDPHALTDSYHSVRLGSRWKEQSWCYYSRTSPDIYSILLSHRPELTKYYRDDGFNLIMAGHAHGGQFRIPDYPGGLLASHQSFFPRHAGGQYALGSTSLIVNRGLYTNRLSRIYNPPGLVLMDLKSIPQSVYPLQSHSFGTAPMDLSPSCWKGSVTSAYDSH